MNNKMRNLTLSAAAFAALMVTAPKASADDRGRERVGRAPGRVFVAPMRSFSRRGFFAPVRAFSGFRFFSYRPGPAYVYIANYGWVLPPFFGAVWVPDHTDIGGFFVEGGWR